MEFDLLDLYKSAGDWTAEKVAGASSQLDAMTPCDGWNVRTLLNHMVDTQNYFASTARGEKGTFPAPTPPELIGDDPVAVFERARAATFSAFEVPGVLEKTGSSLGTASSDLLLHGWDLAKATGQDATMPDDLADAGYRAIDGRFTNDQRPGIFKSEVAVAPGASTQDKYLAYTGRDPSH